MSKVKQQQLDQPILNSSLARQAIINGNFDVWQRGTSFTDPASNTYTASAEL